MKGQILHFIYIKYPEYQIQTQKVKSLGVEGREVEENYYILTGMWHNLDIFACC